MPGAYQRIVKAVFFVSKKPSITDDEFKSHYLEVHIPLSAEPCAQYGAIEYNVVGATW